jgi:hypothetical protein
MAQKITFKSSFQNFLLETQINMDQFKKKD